MRKIIATTFSFYTTNATGSMLNLAYDDMRTEYTFSITQNSTATVIFTD